MKLFEILYQISDLYLLELFLFKFVIKEKTIVLFKLLFSLSNNLILNL